MMRAWQLSDVGATRPPNAGRRSFALDDHSVTATASLPVPLPRFRAAFLNAPPHTQCLSINSATSSLSAVVSSSSSSAAHFGGYRRSSPEADHALS